MRGFGGMVCLDVGGGYEDTGLSDTTLLWMVAEAHEQRAVAGREGAPQLVGAARPPLAFCRH